MDPLVDVTESLKNAGVHSSEPTSTKETPENAIADEEEVEDPDGEDIVTSLNYFEDLEACETLIKALDALLPASAAASECCSEEKIHLLPTASEEPDGAAAKADQLMKLLDRYQELPHLLHPYLEQLVRPLIWVLLRFLPSATKVWEWEQKQAEKSPSGKNSTADDDNDDNNPLVVMSRLGQNFDHFDADAPKEALHLVCRVLYVITKTAGEKACTSHFPNEVRHFEDVFYALRWWARSPRRQREWEVRYCLLIWLSNLVLVPFSMHLIDTNSTKRMQRQQQQQPGPIVAHVRYGDDNNNHTTISTESKNSDNSPKMECGAGLMHTAPVSQNADVEDTLSLSDASLVTAVSFLCDATKCRDGAALLVGRLLTRPDSKHHRDVFFRFANDVVRHVPAQKRCPGFLWDGVLAALSRRGIYDVVVGDETNGLPSPAALSSRLLPGVLLAVAKTMKMAQRREVVRYAEALIEHIVEDLWDPIQAYIEERGGVGGDTLVLKLSVKVVQRLILSMLKKRSAMWKYQKSSVASLAVNLGSSDTATSGRKAVDDDLEDEMEADDEEIDGDDSVLELGLGLLLEALSHKDTVVRWSAAKGIGRVCDRLPPKMASEVVMAVFDLLADDEFNDSVWHGAMLAIAELCRRGSITRDRLEAAVPLIERGLGYDIAKGTYSVGAHVRDAASYTCWSVARAYDPGDLTAHVHRLSGALVVTSLFDRQVNVRRAASAAFQECVGRLGNFPHGIELSTTMDFFSLASLSNAFLQVAPKVAKFEAYRSKMVDVLLSEKLLHWDRRVRMAAAGALGKIAPLEVDAVLSRVLPVLLERVTDNMVATRHGAILGLAELVRHLPPRVWSVAQITDMVSVFPRLDTARLFRSRGGEHVRDACCRLLEAFALHPLPLPDVLEVVKMNGMKGKVKTMGKLQEFLEETWSSILDWLQLSATKAFHAFAGAYYTQFQPLFHGKVLHKMLSGVMDEKVPLLQRRGGIAAIGGVPSVLLVASPPPNAERGAEVCTAALADHHNNNIPAGEEGEEEPYFVHVVQLLSKLAISPPTSDAQQPNDLVGSKADHNSSVASPRVTGWGDEPTLDTVRADPECRRNAVTSLCRVLMAIPISHPAYTEKIYTSSVRTLLAALQDYATDNRGDVGSFVRLSVLEHVAGVALHGLRGPSPPLCSASILLEVLQGLVRVLFEKLDRVREAAGLALEALLVHEDGERYVVQQLWSESSSQGREVRVLAAMVRQHHAKVKDTHPGVVPPQNVSPFSVEVADWRTPSIMAVMGPVLLRHTPVCFAQSVADGLTASAGDLTDHVRLPALQALRSCFSEKEDVLLPPAVQMLLRMDEDESHSDLVLRLSKTFVCVGERYEHVERLVVPLSRVLDYLYTHQLLSETEHIRTVQLLRSEMKFYSTAIRTLLPLVTLLASLCRSPCYDARKQAWTLALTMIASRYPKVRAMMATELYTALLSLTSSLECSDKPQTSNCAEDPVCRIPVQGCLDAMNHIIRVQWDGTDAAAIRAARNELYRMLAITPPATTTAVSGDVQERKKKREIVASTYSALVQEAGY